MVFDMTVLAHLGVIFVFKRNVGLGQGIIDLSADRILRLTDDIFRAGMNFTCAFCQRGLRAYQRLVIFIFHLDQLKGFL